MRKEGYKVLTLTASMIMLLASVVTGIYSIIRFTGSPRQDMTVLTQDTIKSYVERLAYEELAVSCFVALLFGIFGIAMSFTSGNYYSKGERYFLTSIWLIAAIVTISIFAAPAINKLAYKPQVVAVQVTGRQKGHISAPYSSFIFRFSNGSRHNVSREEYDNVPNGAKYYVIMCGPTCAGAFNPDNCCDLS